jgi:hypothetical protein
MPVFMKQNKLVFKRVPRFVIVVRSWDRLHGRAGCGYHDDAGCVASRKIVVGRRVGVNQLVSSGVT